MQFVRRRHIFILLLLFGFLFRLCTKIPDSEIPILTENYQKHNASQKGCPRTFGRVGIFVVIANSGNLYKVAQESVKCYAESRNYTLIVTDLLDERIQRECPQNQVVLFAKHCAAAVYLEQFDWLLVLDEDTGVINPNHCIEEYIDERVDLIFYERFFNWEIACGNYLVKNTPYSKNFLKQYANSASLMPNPFGGSDNGVLLFLLLKALFPKENDEHDLCFGLWEKATSYETYLNFAMCVKVALGARKLWPHIKIVRRGQGWVMDWFLTGDRWCDANFMMHGWKEMQNGWTSPFERPLTATDCGLGREWPLNKASYISCEAMKRRLLKEDIRMKEYFPSKAAVLPFLLESDFEMCWPNCDSE